MEPKSPPDSHLAQRSMRWSWFELSDIHLGDSHGADLRVRPLSRWWPEPGSKSAQPKALGLLEADQDLAPEIGKRDLLPLDWFANQQLPRGEGPMFSPYQRDLR